jgi:hypothetical protein
VLVGCDFNNFAVGVAGATIAGGGGEGLGSLVDHTNVDSINFGTIGGGSSNMVSGLYGTVAGGGSNTASIGNATVGGGSANTASDGASTVGGDPGGESNTASGKGSFEAGLGARATHDGSFVWADSVPGTFYSSANNDFNIRATGGIRIFANSGYNSGVTVHAGDTTWNSLSDRNAKTNFEAVDPEPVLNGVLTTPISTWNYRTRGDIRHFGPMAQDFYAAFGGLGVDEKHISTEDADGVALAAIQGLYNLRKGEGRAHR